MWKELAREEHRVAVNQVTEETAELKMDTRMETKKDAQKLRIRIIQFRL